MTASFWMKFADRPAGCVEATDESEAERIATQKTGSTPISCASLPYPASPRIHPHKYDDGSTCPAFCYEPNKCAGKTSCPNTYRSCVD